MQNRFTMFKRGSVFYPEDRSTGQQKSLQTRDEAEAQRIVQAKNDAVALPQMNLVMAKTYWRNPAWRLPLNDSLTFAPPDQQVV